ncbi:hypothetical protein FM107_10975 [Sphingobacterium sp. JB170]|nr:hypothetical protein FM107_10975 [Sphingobacterium sp. JB170]
MLFCFPYNLVGYAFGQTVNFTKGKMLYCFYAFTVLKPYAFIPNYLQANLDFFLV